MPPGRVQAVRIVEPLLWRRRGWVRVELDVAGTGNQGGTLLPVAGRDELLGLVGSRLLGDQPVDLPELVEDLDASRRPARGLEAGHRGLAPARVVGPWKRDVLD